MKRAIIPIFIPHMGCPNDCVFCNQKKIAGCEKPVDFSKLADMVESYLVTMDGTDVVEMAFFGGSFTGIDPKLQEAYLSFAFNYKKNGDIDRIRMSTRPDYIDRGTIERLLKYSVDTVELGVQSLDQVVMDLSRRNHTVVDVLKAVNLLKDAHIELGIQLMLGLPGDNFQKVLETAKRVASLKPAFIRIYPTVVIKDTTLERLYREGLYQPLSLGEAVDQAKAIYTLMRQADIEVIRMGLQTTEMMLDDTVNIAGPFHPAFRQLVMSSLWLDRLEEVIKTEGDYTIQCHKANESVLKGHKKSNLLYLQETYGELKVSFDYRDMDKDKVRILCNSEVYELQL